MENLSYASILDARNRLNGLIHQTPVLRSQLLNDWLGHEVFFKAECLQKVGAFKSRGALNAVSAYIQEKGETPKRVIANSSGNHAQAVAWACSQKDIPCVIYMPEDTSKVKVEATRSYGAKIVQLPTRAEVDAATNAAAEEDGIFWIPPYNHDWVIAGQGTAVAESLEQVESIDAVFAPCGGGGLVSGTLIATRHLSPRTQVVGVEPLNANDAFQSRQKGKIVGFSESPESLADGARTLSVGSKTFPFIQALDDLTTCSEQRLIYWTQWLSHLLKLRIEPTGALAMQGVVDWLRTQRSRKRVLMIVTGGNMDAFTTAKVWEMDALNQLPSLDS